MFLEITEVHCYLGLTIFALILVLFVLYGDYKKAEKKARDNYDRYDLSQTRLANMSTVYCKAQLHVQDLIDEKARMKKQLEAFELLQCMVSGCEEKIDVIVSFESDKKYVHAHCRKHNKQEIPEGQGHITLWERPIVTPDMN